MPWVVQWEEPQYLAPSLVASHPRKLRLPGTPVASAKFFNKLLGGWFRFACCARHFGILAAEAFDASCRIHQFLLAGKKRVARGTDFYVDVALVCGTSRKAGATSALHANLVVIRMNILLRHLQKPFLQ